MTYLLIVSVFFLLAGLQALGLAWFGLRGFSYERSFSRPAAYEGESVELIEVIQNRSPFFLPWVRVETSIPPSFSFSTREAVEVRGGHFHTSVFTLAPFSRVTRRHHVTLTRRGHYALQQASITAGDLMGMRTLLRDVEAPAEISVWPKLFADLQHTLSSSRSQGDLSVRRWIQRASAAGSSRIPFWSTASAPTAPATRSGTSTGPPQRGWGPSRSRPTTSPPTRA